jgi:UDP-N-acetylmuramyl tripeptide synthase
MNQAVDYERWTTMPDGSTKIVRCVASPMQAGMSFFYREPTALDFVGMTMSNHNTTLDAALYQWYVRTEGWHEAQWYSKQFIGV